MFTRLQIREIINDDISEYFLTETEKFIRLTFKMMSKFNWKSKVEN